MMWNIMYWGIVSIILVRCFVLFRMDQRFEEKRKKLYYILGFVIFCVWVLKKVIVFPELLDIEYKLTETIMIKIKWREYIEIENLYYSTPVRMNVPKIVLGELFWYTIIINSAFVFHILICNWIFWIFKSSYLVENDKSCNRISFRISRISFILSLSSILYVLSWVEYYWHYYNRELVKKSIVDICFKDVRYKGGEKKKREDRHFKELLYKGVEKEKCLRYVLKD